MEIEIKRMKAWKSMKVIAWYLPQFHDIPENSEWWGEGFTDWVNVKKGQKYAADQRQPRVPLNNNYYDLSKLETLQWQVDLANKYGVYGFCFHHYWFGGKLLLEKPMEMFLAHPELDLHFCINWANEHWTMRWQGDDKVLIEQEYGGEKEWIEHFNYFLPFFKDPRYIRIDGKPLLVLFLPDIIPFLEPMISCWQRLAHENGLPGICVSYANRESTKQHLSKKELALFDFSIDYHPTAVFHELERAGKRGLYGLVRSLWLRTGKPLLNTLHLNSVNIHLPLRVYKYDEIWRTILQMDPIDSTNIPGAISDWDNTPRRHQHGRYFSGATPEAFYTYFKQMLLRARKDYKKDMIFIFAWNEWAEGGYLEPDEDYGCGYLEAIHRALEETGELEGLKN